MTLRRFAACILFLISWPVVSFAIQSAKPSPKQITESTHAAIEKLEKKFNEAYEREVGKILSLAKAQLAQKGTLAADPKSTVDFDSQVKQAEREIESIPTSSPCIRLRTELDSRAKTIAIMRNLRSELSDKEKENKKLIAFAQAARPFARIPPNAVVWNGHHYLSVTESFTYAAAIIRCQVAGGHLVRIDSADEHQFLRSLVAASVVRSYWVDGTDELEESKWTFSDGTPMVYNGWASREPNGGRNENFAQILGAPNWMLNDSAAGQTTYFICEWDF